MKNKIAIITSGHPAEDDRIYWRFARTLSANNFPVSIITSLQKKNYKKENILLTGFDGSSISKTEKTKIFYNYLVVLKPDIIICCEPLTILSAHKYKKLYNKNCMIISDITEWYPNYNTLKLYFGLNRAITYCIHLLFNIYTSNLADHLIIGEEGKAKRYKIISPLKKKTIISYYPPGDIFSYRPLAFNDNKFSICYSGKLNDERGFFRLIEVVKKLAAKIPEKFITLKIIGSDENGEASAKLNEISSIQNVSVIFSNQLEYYSYAAVLSESHLCIDLREKSKLFNNSLPIKIFDIMAAGRPVIFSNLKSFYQLPEVNEFGFLVDPDDIEKTVELILRYVNDSQLLIKHSRTARKLFEQKYNWEKHAEKLLQLLK